MTAAIAVAVSWLLAPVRFDAAKTDIKVDFDKKFSFTGLRTWTWRPDGKGDVRLAVSSHFQAASIDHETRHSGR